ncbi:MULTISPECIES: site-2 protease family protein [Clostridium]|jgi:hypothetical protein|nr:site-2 protease family protein [Clostridium sp.]
MMILQYLILILKVFIIEYIIIFLHELSHYVVSLFLGFKCSFYHVIPFTLYKDGTKFKFKFKPLIQGDMTSRLHFNSIKISSKIEYNILLKKLKIFLWIGPVFDFTVFILFFCIGVSNVKYSYLALISLIHLSITTLNFFNSDGKYAIGAKEDSRIAFELVRSFTICGNGEIPYESKRILTDTHMEIADGITLEKFDVNDLWNFLNNISFFTNSLLSFLNKDLLIIHPSTLNFFENLINDFDDIKKYDYRQVEKTSIAIIYYFISKKLKEKTFYPDDNIINKVYAGCNSIYFRKLFDLYFNSKNDNIEYLINEKNMPNYISHCEGYNKLIINIINLYENTLI